MHETIGADHHLQLRFPPFRDMKRVRVQVFADDQVDVFVVPPEGLEAFERGSSAFRYWAAARDVQEADLRVRVRPRTRWYVLIVNNTGEDVDVSYDVLW